jgi:hypothetical protein
VAQDFLICQKSKRLSSFGLRWRVVCSFVGAEDVTMELDVARRVAIAKLLAQPDPPELRRGHRLRLEGKPNRFDLVPILAAVFVQAKLLALEERRAQIGSTPADVAVVVVKHVRKVVPVAA